jgi:hypothetical protein
MPSLALPDPVSVYRNAMSCKIERLATGKDSVVLRVSGRIDGDYVDALRDVIEREEGQVAIDLSEVMLVDREAVRLLAFSENNGTELRNCPAYIREWVTRERIRVGSDLSDLNRGATNDADF